MFVFYILDWIIVAFDLVGEQGAKCLAVNFSGFQRHCVDGLVGLPYYLHYYLALII